MGGERDNLGSDHTRGQSDETSILALWKLGRQHVCTPPPKCLNWLTTTHTLPCYSPKIPFLRLRNKNIETWDIRKLPSREENDPTHTGPAFAAGTPAPAAPPRLQHLTCAANSPDFWVEPHGLCVAVYGPPRHSQRFGAKHAFWPWPRDGDTGGDFSCSYASNSKAKGGSSGISGSGSGIGVRGVEVVVPGVVCDSDYRLCLSTGVKFSDTRLATVLDSSRVLVDEMMVAQVQVQEAGPTVGEGDQRVTTTFLSS